MLSFDTTQPSQVKGINGYTVDPILTVGDKVGNYAIPGIPDGIGAFALNDTTVRVLVVSELGNTVGYKYKLKNGLELPGARANYVDIDKRTLQVTDAGLAYDTIINREGKEIKVATDLENGGINRFCSAALFEANQFGAGKGLADRIFFSGEETLGGTQFALDVKTNILYAVPWFGRAGWENVTEIDTGTTDKVAFIIGDDGNAPLTMYVGEKNAKKDGSFLDSNGLAQGKLFAWVADDPTDAADKIETSSADFKGTNSSTKGKFVEIAYYDPTKKGTAVDGPDTDTTIQNDLGYDAQGFATYAQQSKLATDAKAFFFNRVEDVSTSPTDATQVAFNVTGVDGTSNIFGSVYKIDVDFNDLAKGDITGKVDILYDGNDEGKKDLGLRSPDNLDWADDGKIYINEDRAISAALFAGTGKAEASIFSIDPSVVDPSKTLTRIAQVDRSAVPAGQNDINPTDVGNWETSGILDVSNLFGNKPGEVFLFDVQAHSVKGGSIISATNVDGNGDGTKTDAENLVEGGQLSFLIAPNAKINQSGELLVPGGTAGDDKLIAGNTPGIDGIRNVIFTGAGKDEVDTAIGGTKANNNRIDTGSGNDMIYIADADRSFGSAGDDVIEASDAKDYRASGGAGADTFYLGTNGRALGGDGNDKFFVGTGGGNLISGGASVDQFWIANGDTPAAANTILDFQVGTDVIGIQGATSLGISASTLVLTQVGADTSIGFGGQTLAILKGIQSSSLTPSDANQFVFA
jgi:serralysin